MQKSKTRAYIATAGIIIVVIITIILLIWMAFPSRDSYSVELEMWGPIDDSRLYENLSREYREANPFMRRVTYRKFLVDEYKEDLLDALAAGNGPDIFLIRNTWVPEFQDKIVPAPAELVNEATIGREFVNVVADDVLIEGSVYGVPLFVDSLALYYNKDLFDFAGITQPPKTWSDLIRDSRKLTISDDREGLTQSGVALGTAENINSSTDILNALFLQMGTGLEHNRELSGVNLGDAGRQAIDFYTQFSDVNASSYTWNIKKDYSIDAFGERGVAMMINYSWHYDTIKRKNSRLNFAVAPLPQFEGLDPKNYANYWVFVVAENKDADSVSVEDRSRADTIRTQEAWQYLRYLTLHKGGEYVLTNFLEGTQKAFSLTQDPAKTYAQETNTPAARRDIVELQKNDPVLGPFAQGNLLARSWRQGDAEAIETLMAEVIDSVYFGQSTSREAVRTLEERIRTYNRR